MSRSLVHRLLLALLLCCSLISAIPSAARADGLTPVEREVVDLINQQRAAHGLPALQVDPRLTTAARVHTDLMRERGQPSHQLDGEKPICQGDDRLRAAGYAWTFCAENVAAGQTSAQQVVDAWMNSEGHRHNILNPNARETGIAFAAGGGTYSTWWTQTFGAPAGGQAPAPGAAPSNASSELQAALLAQGQSRQVIQFNPGAALQQRIFAHGFVPNSGEFSLTVDGVAYVGQRAERLDTGAVRVYYAPVNNTAAVRLVEAGTPNSALDRALLDAANQRQAIQFNPGAALQQRIFAHGFVPNSPEYSVSWGGATFAAQRAENLATGRVRVYYVRTGDWGAVQTVER